MLCLVERTMRMSLRVQRFYYSVATCCALAATVATVVWGIRPMSAPPEKSTSGDSVSTTSANVNEKRAPARGDFAKLWDRRLRRPLYDPPPPKPEVKQLPPLRVELLGTILEEANSMALVRSDKGSVEYKRVGDSVGPAEGAAKLVEIAADAIIVERAQERVTLKVNSKDLR